MYTLLKMTSVKKMVPCTLPKKYSLSMRGEPMGADYVSTVVGMLNTEFT